MGTSTLSLGPMSPFSKKQGRYRYANSTSGLCLLLVTGIMRIGMEITARAA